jgi:hypothetical protein
VPEKTGEKKLITLVFSCRLRKKKINKVFYPFFSLPASLSRYRERCRKKPPRWDPPIHAPCVYGGVWGGVAGAPIAGRTHSSETPRRAQMSISQQIVDRSGANHPRFGKSHSDETRAKISELPAMSGANHPKYGKVPAHAMTVNVYSIDNVLVQTFSSQVACGEWLDVSHTTVQNYIKSGGKQK